MLNENRFVLTVFLGILVSGALLQSFSSARKFDSGTDSSNAQGEAFQIVYLGDCDPFWCSKPLFAPSVRTLPRHPATQNLDRLVHWLKQALLRASCVPSAPQTRARRNVARGVEVLRGTPPPRHRARPPRPAVMIMH